MTRAVRSCILGQGPGDAVVQGQQAIGEVDILELHVLPLGGQLHIGDVPDAPDAAGDEPDRKSTRLNSSHWIESRLGE